MIFNFFLFGALTDRATRAPAATATSGQHVLVQMGRYIIGLRSALVHLITLELQGPHLVSGSESQACQPSTNHRLFGFSDPVKL